MKYTVREIAALFPEAEVYLSKPDELIAQLVIDTRPSYQFHHALFIALRGSQRDGHAFIHQAYTKGIQSFLVHHLPDDYQSYSCNFIVHPEPLKGLQKLASWHRSKFAIPVIAITGSNGKTIVKEWFSQVATGHLSLVKSPKSYNSQIGVPLSVWQMNEQHALGLFEAGISQPGEMEALQAILKPKIGVFTTLGTAHEENFPSQKEKMYEKALLFKGCEKVVFPADEKLVKEVLEEVLPPAVLQGWSWKDDNTPFKLSWVEQGPSDEKPGLHMEFPSKETLTFYPAFFDQASVHNLITTAALLYVSGIPLPAIEKGLYSLRNIDSRLQLRPGKKGCLIIDDTYNNDLSGLKVALHYLNSFLYGKGKMAILSDIAQVKNLNQVYSAVAESLVQHGVSSLLSVGNDFRVHFKAPSQLEWIAFEDTQALVSYLREYAPKDKVVLVKGSRRYQLEKVSDVLVESLHPTRLEINLERVLNNLRGFRSKLTQPATKIMVMLKASAYGTGATELAKLLEFQGVDYFAVAYTEEGIELREAGVSTPIMVMNTRPEQYALLIQYRLEPEIFSFQSLFEFYVFCKNNDLKSGMHINLDVGMHRLGFLPDDIPELGSFLKKAGEVLEVKSIYAHMVASGNPLHDDFTEIQIKTFKVCSHALTSFLPAKPLLHMVNTEGILRFPQAHFDMVRLGIGLYGMGSADFLKPAVRLVSTISQIKWLDANQTVGYNRAGRLNRKSKIGIIAMGYADGLSRHLGNGKGGAYLRGARVPFVGDICMDMSMVDLTDVDGVLEGDEVELFGDHQSIENFAEVLGTIPYDILSSLNRRVQRIFYFD